MLKFPIYMDNNATTRTDPRVVEAMLPFFTEVYGNSASRSHPFGWAAEKAVEKARQQVHQYFSRLANMRLNASAPTVTGVASATPAPANAAR